MKLIANTIESAQDIKDFIYNDVEPNDLSTSQRDMFNKLIEDIDRKY